MSICLCMVVKNEAELIRSALQSAKPYISSWSVVDTGSTDNTRDIIREKLKDMPGTLHRREWRDYGYNRTEAIQLARESGADFILILDADETIICPNGYVLPDLDSNLAYWMTIKYGNVSYSRPNLISTKQNWQYIGVTHEYLTAFPVMPPVCLLPLTIQTHPSRSTKSVERCKEDERLLRQALELEPNNSRYVFYLAQSLRDYGEISCAIKWYQKRTEMGGWYEEVWYSYFQIAQLKEKIYSSVSEVVDAYLQAYNYNPARAESLGAPARYLRLFHHYNSAILFAEKAISIPRPNEFLFLDDSYYTWRNADEFAISAYWVGRFKESFDTCEALLKFGVLPEHEIERVEKNRRFAEEKLQSLYVATT